MVILEPARTVITVHDIIPILASKGYFAGITHDRRRWLSEWTARFYRRAACIIAPSDNTKQDLITHCGCDPERIQVIYNGINPAFVSDAPEKAVVYRKVLGLPPDKRLVLIVGEAFYKNQLTSLRVMEHLQARYGETIQLVSLGQATRMWRAACRRSPFRRQIIQIDCLPAQEMPKLYNAVDCLLFPSWYEGFGWPPAEALSCGTPVVISDSASLPEIGGDAAVVVRPDNVAGLAQAVIRLLEEPPFRKECVKKGLAHVKHFSWTKNAKRVMAVYKSIVEA
jgi:glycosyltransferase involved in cell wall biosynthesis